MVRINDVGDRIHLPSVIELYRQFSLVIGGRYQFSVAEILQRVRGIFGCHPKSDPVTGRADGPVERKNKAGLFFSATMMDRSHTEASVKPFELGNTSFCNGKFGVPDKRAITKYPESFIRHVAGPFCSRTVNTITDAYERG